MCESGLTQVEGGYRRAKVIKCAMTDEVRTELQDQVFRMSSMFGGHVFKQPRQKVQQKHKLAKYYLCVICD